MLGTTQLATHSFIYFMFHLHDLCRRLNRREQVATMSNKIKAGPGFIPNLNSNTGMLNIII